MMRRVPATLRKARHTENFLDTDFTSLDMHRLERLNNQLFARLDNPQPDRGLLGRYYALLDNWSCEVRGQSYESPDGEGTGYPR